MGVRLCIALWATERTLALAPSEMGGFQPSFHVFSHLTWALQDHHTQQLVFIWLWERLPVCSQTPVPFHRAKLHFPDSFAARYGHMTKFWPMGCEQNLPGATSKPDP